jgi:hypothetical protein
VASAWSNCALVDLRLREAIARDRLDLVLVGVVEGPLQLQLGARPVAAS